MRYALRNNEFKSGCFWNDRASPFLTVWLMVAVPTRQGRIASVCEQKFECRRFNMTVTKHHVGLALVTGIRCLAPP